MWGKIGAAALVLWSSAGWAQAFDNKSVVALHHAGLGDATILAKVNSQPCGYDVSTAGLVALKTAGLSDAVIAAMIDRCSTPARATGTDSVSADPTVAHAPGIYIMQDWLSTAQMRALRPSKASAIKVSGNGSLLFPFVGRLVLPGGQSHMVVVSHRPTFYFYFPANDRNVADFGTPNSVAAQSPEEFSLVQFKVKGDERAVGIGRMTAYSARRGIDGKDAIRFEGSEIGGSAYKVRIDRDLEPGEYAFVLTGANNAARVYDFTIS